MAAHKLDLLSYTVATSSHAPLIARWMSNEASLPSCLEVCSPSAWSMFPTPSQVLVLNSAVPKLDCTA